VLTIHVAGCAECHGSADPTVVAAITNGGASCETCHGAYLSVVPAHVAPANASHAVSGSCYTELCHKFTDVGKLHTEGDDPPGCVVCHPVGETSEATIVCGTAGCHPDLAPFHGHVHANATGDESSACVSCHGTDLVVAHDGTFIDGDALGCFCHTTSWLSSEMGPLLEAGESECVDCHKGTYAAHDFNNTASGHSTTTYGKKGPYTKFDGSEGPLLHAIEMSETSPTYGEITTLTTDWEFPQVNVFWSATDTAAPADAIKGLTEDDVITCQDCHTGLNSDGPHGAAQNWGIDPNYPGDFDYAELTKWIITNPSGIKVRSTFDPRLPRFPTQASWDTSGYAYFSGVPTTSVSVNFDGQNHAIICSKCHDLMNFQSGFMDERAPSMQKWMTMDATGTKGVATDTVTGFINPSGIGSSNVPHAQSHYDNNNGAPQCVNCHIAIPHAWKRPRLIVNSGPGFAFASFPATTSGMPFMWMDNTRVQPADPAPYRSVNQFGTSDGVASYDGVSGGPWWGMEAYPGGEKPNPLQANPNGQQPLPPHDRVDDHDALRVGMQSISATDEHEIIPFAGGSNAPGTYTGLNTDYVEWVEYKCGACDFHHPYSDPRVSDPVGSGGDTQIVVE
jgi:hypothetical protein